MENIEAPEPYETPNFLMKLIQSKKYELKYKDDIYSLLVERYSDENIYFKLRKLNNLSLYHYMNKCNYDDIIKIFLLQREYYDDLTKIFQFFDLAMTKNKIELEFNKDKNAMELKLKKVLDFDEIECKLELNQKKIEKDEMFTILIDEISELKIKKDENKYNNIINELINKNKEYENKIKFLEDKIKILEDEIKKFKEQKNKVVNEIMKSKAQNKESYKEENMIIYLKDDRILAYNEKHGLFSLKLNPDNLDKVPEKSKFVNLGQSVLLTGGKTKDKKNLSKKCYLIGLIENDLSNNINYSINVSQYGDFKEGRERHNLIYLPNKNFVFACGGFYCKSCEYTNVYNGNWELLKPMNKSRGNASMAYVNERFIYIMGGFELNQNLNGNYLNDIEIFDVNNFDIGWKIINFANPNGYYLGLTALGVIPLSKSLFLLCGGYDGKEYKDNVYKVDCNNPNSPLVEKIKVLQNYTIFTHNMFYKIGKNYFNFDFLGQMYEFDHENWKFDIHEINKRGN